ncbi:MAG: DUF2092 domain-containing protein [Proteobacteria bacterium]|nr:DUF2092 domain-containing protein [Pseudomonadota bacterium]
MPRTFTLAAALALLLAAAVSEAQQPQPASAAPATPAAAANPVDADAVRALKAMGTYLQSLKRFTVNTDLVGERVLADGQKLQHMASARMSVQRPDRIRVVMESARMDRELFYDGKTVTLFTPAQNMYSAVPFSGNLNALVDALENHYGVQLPLQDLFLWGTPEAPEDKLDSAMNAGQDIIDGVVCDHYAFRQGMLDWQIWIQSGSRPLPRRLVIVNRADDARPQSASTLDWNLSPSFAPTTFSFVPPKGSRKIELVPVKGN